jgi:ABC-type multidrug transport system fused ATPase/permease subunit
LALLAVLQFFSNSLLVCGLFLGLISISPLPSLAFLALLGLGGWLAVKISRRHLDRTAQAAYAAEYAIAKTTHLVLHGMKEIRLYARENALFSGFTSRLGQAAKAKRHQQTIARLPVAGLETLGFSALILVMLFLIFVQDAGMARISGIMGFMAAAAWRGLPAANLLVDNLSSLRSELPYLGKVAELLNTEKALTEQLLPLPEAPPAPLVFTRDIRLEGLSFRYAQDAVPALADVSLTIQRGSLFGLVGLSGAGKSTLVNLLTGLIPPDAGRLLVDGTPISKDNVASWLQRIGYVAQAPYILDATLAENVALSHWGEDIDRERVLECCRMAALDFLDDLEQGIDTILGDRGVRLSGGQAQRVAIARALYAGPDLIIFDEATSSLDMKNEKAIHDTILALRDQVTVVIIAHRLTTIEGCDTLAWLDKGRVRRMGAAADVLPEYTEELKQAAPASEE